MKFIIFVIFRENAIIPTLLRCRWFITQLALRCHIRTLSRWSGNDDVSLYLHSGYTHHSSNISSAEGTHIWGVPPPRTQTFISDTSKCDQKAILLIRRSGIGQSVKFFTRHGQYHPRHNFRIIANECPCQRGRRPPLYACLRQRICSGNSFMIAGVQVEW